MLGVTTWLPETMMMLMPALVYEYNRSVYISSRQCKRQGYTTLPRTLTLSP